MRKLFVALCIITFCSCNTIQFITPTDELHMIEVYQDIEFIKSKLSSVHIDINWENRKDIIFHQLDKAAIACNPCDVNTFKKSLIPIFKTIDDGHSTIFGIHENSLRQDGPTSIFASTLLDEQSLYLKVSNFKN